MDPSYTCSEDLNAFTKSDWNQSYSDSKYFNSTNLELSTPNPYEETENYNESCKNFRLSWAEPPVEIHEECTTDIDLPLLVWNGYDIVPKLLSVCNTGRTITLNGQWTNGRPYIEGGPLNGKYIFSQIHFHCPSEHEIDGRRYPLEMHVVHYKASYLTQERAMHEKDGTLVLVYLFQAVESGETVLSEITKMSYSLEKVNARVEICKIPLSDLVKPFFCNYYVYWGSVTMKRNSYILQWIINCSQSQVTKEEVNTLLCIMSTCTVSASKGPKMKPHNSIIYRVGENYDLPPPSQTVNTETCTSTQFELVMEPEQAACPHTSSHVNQQSFQAPQAPQTPQAPQAPHCSNCATTYSVPCATQAEPLRCPTHSNQAQCTSNTPVQSQPTYHLEPQNVCGSCGGLEVEYTVPNYTCKCQRAPKVCSSCGGSKSSISWCRRKWKKYKSKCSVRNKTSSCSDTSLSRKNKKKSNKKKCRQKKSSESSCSEKHSDAECWPPGETDTLEKKPMVEGAPSKDQCEKKPEVEPCDKKPEVEPCEKKPEVEPCEKKPEVEPCETGPPEREPKVCIITPEEENRPDDTCTDPCEKPAVTTCSSSPCSSSCSSTSTLGKKKQKKPKKQKKKKPSTVSEKTSVTSVKHTETKVEKVKLADTDCDDKKTKKEKTKKEKSTSSVTESKASKNDSKSGKKSKGAKKSKNSMETSEKSSEQEDSKKKNEKKRKKLQEEEQTNEVTTLFVKTPENIFPPNVVSSVSGSDNDLNVKEKNDDKDQSCAKQQQYIINNVTTTGFKMPDDKKTSKSKELCVQMKHSFHSTKSDLMTIPQEYHVSIVWDSNVLQEYKGMFQPQGISLGSFEKMQLVPKYQEPHDLAVSLKECIIKKPSLDKLCIDSKFLLKGWNTKDVVQVLKKEGFEDEVSQKSFYNTENTELNNISDLKCQSVQTDESYLKIHDKIRRIFCKKLDLQSQNIQTELQDDKKSGENSKELTKCKTKILRTASESEISSGSKKCWQNQFINLMEAKLCKPGVKDSNNLIEKLECKIKLIKNPNNSIESINESAQGIKKTDIEKSDLEFAKRNTVYFMYDRIEKDPLTGKKIFMGRFRTKDDLKILKDHKIASKKDSSKSFASQSMSEKYSSAETHSHRSLNEEKMNSILQNQVQHPGPSQENKNEISVHNFEPRCLDLTQFKAQNSNLVVADVVKWFRDDGENFEVLVDIINTEKKIKSKLFGQSGMTASICESDYSTEGKINCENSNLKTPVYEDKGTMCDSHFLASKNAGNLLGLSSPSSDAVIIVPVEVESWSNIEVLLIERSHDKKGIKSSKKYIPMV